MNRCALFVGMLLGMAFTQYAQADDKPLKGDLARFQGTWTAKVGPEKNIPLSLIFKGETVRLKLTGPDGQTFESDGEYRIDESAKPHKTVDWIKFSNLMGEDVPDNLGIYTFEDNDTLRVCSGDPGNPRPSEFKDGEDGPPRMVVLKREAAAAPPAEGKGDLAKFQGDWTGMMGPDHNFEVKVKVKGSAVTVHFTTANGEDLEMKGELKIDETAQPHKAIDWVNFKRPNGEDAPANLGIYKFEGARVVVCNGGPGNERPAEFKQGDGGPPNLFELTRKDASK